jgi:hypothetical protein
MYACTLLNAGYESIVTFEGDPAFSIVDRVKGMFLAPGQLPDHDYTFYYGRIKMTVLKPFPFDFSLYTRSFGFIGGMGMIRFLAPYALEDSNDVLSLSPINQITNYVTLRFNQTDKNLLYGVSLGMYRVDLTNSVSFINRGFEDSITVQGDESEPGITPDGKPCTFYKGRVTLFVKGYFDSISMCTKSGYSGGYKKLVYNAFYSAPPYPLSVTKTLYRQNTLNILEQTLSFNADTTFQTYRLPIGEYLIFHRYSSYPVTLMNKGKEQLISLESLQPAFIIQGIGPDSKSYLFHYGVFKLKVTGNFSTMSMYCKECSTIPIPLFTYGIS